MTDKQSEPLHGAIWWIPLASIGVPNVAQFAGVVCEGGVIKLKFHHETLPEVKEGSAYPTIDVKAEAYVNGLPV